MDSTPTTEQQLRQLIDEILQTFFELRAAGQRLGLVTQGGNGSWGLLRELKSRGPTTIADLAHTRGVSRQYIQKLAQELMALGWVARGDNPGHQRSYFLLLTATGKKQLERMDQTLEGHLRTLAPLFEEVPLSEVNATLGRLRGALAARNVI